MVIEDHLILVYPQDNDPPYIIGDEHLRALCHGDQGSYFSVQADGSLVPGWKKLMDFYGWLQGKAKLNRGLNIGPNREGYLVVSKGQDTPASSMGSAGSKDMVAVKKGGPSDWPEQALNLRQEFVPRSEMAALVQSAASSIFSRMDRLEASTATKDEVVDMGQNLSQQMATKDELAAFGQRMVDTIKGINAELDAMQQARRGRAGLLPVSAPPPRDVYTTSMSIGPPTLAPGIPLHMYVEEDYADGDGDVPMDDH